MIRTFRAADAPALADLLRPLVLHDEVATSENLLYRRLMLRGRGHRRWLVAETDGAIVGHAHVEPAIFNAGVHLVWVGVAHAHRRRGLGTRLFDQVLAGATAVGVRRLRARTDARDQDGLSFLEHRRFERTSSYAQWTIDPRRDAGTRGALLRAAARDGFRVARLPTWWGWSATCTSSSPRATATRHTMSS